MKFIWCAVLASVLGVVSHANADPRENLNWGTQVNAGTCQRVGPQVINVTGKVIHDVDSGLAGNNWAFDDLNRTIQVWAQPDGKYCAVVRNSGQFDAQAGQTSPGNNGPLTGEEDGTFEGGYVLIIDGVLNPAPAWKTKGNIGIVDYACDINGNCPGYASWLTTYFTVNTYSYEFWGWVYHGISDNWVNSSEGTSGDVF